MTDINQTDKALSIADKAVRVMNASTENLKKVINDFTAFAEQSASLILEIEFKQNQLDYIDNQLVVKVREQEADPHRLTTRSANGCPGVFAPGHPSLSASWRRSRRGAAG